MHDRKITFFETTDRDRKTPIWVAYFEYGGPYFESIRSWCEERWGHQYKNERWQCETNIGYESDLPCSYRPARLTFKTERAAFEFKMRWI